MLDISPDEGSVAARFVVLPTLALRRRRCGASLRAAVVLGGVVVVRLLPWSSVMTTRALPRRHAITAMGAR